MTMDGKFHEGKIQIFQIWGRQKEIIGSPKLVKAMLIELVEAIGMTLHGWPHIVYYPTPELGNTIFAFVGYQPLYESYIVYDNWIEFDPPYANLVINSCKTYDTATARRVINEHLDCLSIKTEAPIFYDGKL